MNEFIILNWYHFDLNHDIIKKLKSTNKINYYNKEKIIIKERLDMDFKLKIKYD